MISVVDDTVARLSAAEDTLRQISPETHELLLRTLAQHVVTSADELADIACAETNLAPERIRGEIERTASQLHLMAEEVRAGSLWDAVIEHSREGQPDIRRSAVPVGIVAVFTASNFPLAFGVLGNDTSAALAARCPVVVRVHPLHPGTGTLLGRIAQSASAAAGLPECPVEVIIGTDIKLGAELVLHPQVAAVGFTGSQGGGKALISLAASRPIPIPVFAEMGSMNPVIISPTAANSRTEQIAQGLVDSATSSMGQMCTKPGIVLIPNGASGDLICRKAKDDLARLPSARLISDTFATRVKQRSDADTSSSASAVAPVEELDGSIGFAVSEISLERAIADATVLEEVFGPYVCLVRYDDVHAAVDFVTASSGTLVTTVHLEPEEEDNDWVRELFISSVQKSGRIVCNGWPTGVAVTDAMVHGGPWPATNAPATSSVGTLAIRRFLRPVCWQDTPDTLLPPQLRESNPWCLTRRIDKVKI